MKNLWADENAQAWVSRCADVGVDEDMALRLYTARLLGGEAALVLHGGGNVSLKARITDQMGDDLTVMYIKGSGQDMARLEAAEEGMRLAIRELSKHDPLQRSPIPTEFWLLVHRHASPRAVRLLDDPRVVVIEEKAFRELRLYQLRCEQ